MMLAAVPSMLDPVGPDGARIERLWWVMLLIAAGVFLVVMWLLIGAIARRRRIEMVHDDRRGRRMIIWGGLIGPVIVLAGVFTLATLDLRALSENRPASLEVTVVGKQWWWEVVYPDSGVVTANEIHLPVGEEIRFVLETDDVIHSFWVPQAGTKRDMIPGKANQLTLSFAEAGTYRGVCAEFCGLQHARMQLVIVAQPRPEFEAWLATQAQPAAAPTSPAQERGLAVFRRSACIGCHTIRGVSEAGIEGPDLTHLASRSTIGAAALDMNHESLTGWVDDPGRFKPGVRMPPAQLEDAALADLVAYLESLQ